MRAIEQDALGSPAGSMLADERAKAYEQIYGLFALITPNGIKVRLPMGRIMKLEDSSRRRDLFLGQGLFLGQSSGRDLSTL